MTISAKFAKELKSNNRLKALIAIEHDCTVYTIDRWFRTNDIKKLTAIATLYMDLIKKETGLSAEDILQESTVKAAKKSKRTV
jgi:hypothetical protein